MGTKKVGPKTFSTDRVMIQLWHTLERDLRRYTNSETAHPSKKLLTVDTVSDFRDYTFPARSQVSSKVFKAEAQLQGLLKRYIFKRDKYTPRQLETMTDDLFVDVQKHVCQHMYHQEPLWVKRIVQTARGICKTILGPYDEERHMSLCSFGTKATTGSPASNSYLDSKVGCLTGTVAHHMWLNKCLEKDPFLQSILQKHGVGEVVRVLFQTNVPKSFKILRGITPNTTLGNFYTIGLGRMIEEQLRDNARLNIKTLQQKHREWVEEFSKTLTHATGDLSSASHCYTSALVNRMVPRKWFNALNLGRIRYVDLKGKMTYQASFMAMGIGFTFPLQTLCFYALLKSISVHTGIRGKISVYGDDLIYPSRMHPFVLKCFAHLGFKMNVDKTFVEDSFRESCGADFFRGVDVRPFQPEGQAAELVAKRYLAFIYKLINGLLLRWKVSEVRESIRTLILEALRVTRHIHAVPTHYPDYSGIKMDGVPGFDVQIPWAKTWCSPSTGAHCFPCLGMTAADRHVEILDVYVWDKLRANSRVSDNVEYFGVDLARRTIDKWLYDVVVESPRWIIADPQPKNYRSKLKPVEPVDPCYKGRPKQKRLKLRIPVVAKYGTTKFVYTTGESIYIPEVGNISL